MADTNVTQFPSGAIRDTQGGKEDWTETIPWLALWAYAKFMTAKKAKYGAGNFKKGIPTESYEQSLIRHWHKYFCNKYEGGRFEPDEDHVCSMLFNILGILYERERANLATYGGNEVTGGTQTMQTLGNN